MTLQYKPLANPILLLSDAPEALTGLARIGRDLASLLCTMPEFRVGYLGRGGVGRVKFPWMQYSFPESGQWGEGYIASVWEDFSRGDDGVIFSTWDASRMLWFAQSNVLPGMEKFLGSGRNFSKWGYFAVDGTGPDQMSLGAEGGATVAGYDRVLAASEWGQKVLVSSGRPDADWLPHGILMDTFKPIGTARNLLDWAGSNVYVGCNMANQSRKDFPAAFEAAAILKSDYGNRFHFWLHTDLPIRYWNIYALAADYGVKDCLEVTTELTDEQLALRYSACDCTMLPSAAEGFGYPIAESMACGTACIVTDYAAGPELTDESWRVPPMCYRVDTIHNVRRAVLSGYAFAQKAKDQIEKKREDWEYRGEQIRSLVDHLDWGKLRVVWERWFREGLR